MKDMITDPDDSGHDSNFIFDETIDYSAPRFRGQANNPTNNPSDLAERRWREPILLPGELADLLRATKGPEPAASAARDTIARRFHRLVLKEVKPYCDGRNNDDLIAAGMFGLAEAIDRFDPRRNNGFAAYAISLIRGRIKKAAKALKRNGWAGETRLQRALYGNHDLTPEQASRVMGRPVDEGELEEAEAQVLGMCSEPEPYDTRERAFEDDEDEESKPCLVAVAPPCPRLQELDAKLIMRHGWLSDGCGNSRGRKFGVHLVGDADRREIQRLKEIGRRAYALELVERDHARIAARAEPTQYLYRIIPPCKPRGPVSKRLGGALDRYPLQIWEVPYVEPKVHTPQPSRYRTANGVAVFVKKQRFRPKLPKEIDPINPPFRMPRLMATRSAACACSLSTSHSQCVWLFSIEPAALPLAA
jgi:RNA polymerase sigma factor (sigma-70 family)